MPETLVRTFCSSGPIRQNGQEKSMVTSETSSRPLGVMPSPRRKPTVRGGRGSSRSRLPPRFSVLSREVVSLAELPEKLSEVENRPSNAAVQGTVVRSGEVLLLSLEDHEEGSARSR